MVWLGCRNLYRPKLNSGSGIRFAVLHEMHWEFVDVTLEGGINGLSAFDYKLFIFPGAASLARRVFIDYSSRM
jgi:hypothetical protein